MSSAFDPLLLRRVADRALDAVLKPWLNLPVTAVAPGVHASVEGVGPGWQAAVAVCGERITGEVRLHLPEGFVREAWARLLGESPSDPGEMEAHRDFVGELTNMVAGRVAAVMGEAGWSCQLGTPVVSFSLVRPEFPPHASETVRTEWICAGHWLTLDLRCFRAGT